ncbi:hypothetical protein FQA39_LY10944 [Lamprigera yunnana]|nr:hypothetical protein FQA39_LY10944 [Lamprigera yunnana]
MVKCPTNGSYVQRFPTSSKVIKKQPQNYYLENPKLLLGTPMNNAGQDVDGIKLYSLAKLRNVCFAGIVNRGDSFRRRRSRSNSLCPPALIGTPSPVMDGPDHVQAEVTKYSVALLGSQGVGKTALISQFMTSECINAYDRPKGVACQHISGHECGHFTATSENENMGD